MVKDVSEKNRLPQTARPYQSNLTSNTKDGLKNYKYAT
jgi:hypothetical protein